MTSKIISGSGSGEFTDPDTHKPDETLSKEKLPINKAPVLYLRRRRTTDFPRIGDVNEELGHGEVLWSPNGVSDETRKIAKVDGGEIYPNHHSIARAGQVEWVKFRDYKRLNTKWIKQVELVID